MTVMRLNYVGRGATRRVQQLAPGIRPGGEVANAIPARDLSRREIVELSGAGSTDAVGSGAWLAKIDDFTTAMTGSGLYVAVTTSDPADSIGGI